MKNKLSYLFLSLVVFSTVLPIKEVFATVATNIKAGGELLEFDNQTISNHNEDNTAVFEYTSEYEGGILTLENYNGGYIEIEHIVGTGTIEENPKVLFIRIVGDNYITSEDVAIISNINFNIIGNGNLTIKSKSLYDKKVEVTIEDTVKVKIEEKQEVSEEKQETEEVEEPIKKTNTLVNMALVCFIVLSTLGIVLLFIKIVEKLKK